MKIKNNFKLNFYLGIYMVAFRSCLKYTLFTCFAFLAFWLSSNADDSNLSDFSTIMRNPDKFDNSKHDILFFKNKDMLHGTLIDGNFKNGISWKPLNAFGTIAFKPNNISSIKMGKCRMPDIGSYTKLIFTNGDSILGNVLSFQGGKLKFKSAFGNIVSIDSRMLKALVPAIANMEILYTGPENASSWKSTSWGETKKKPFIQDGELIVPAFSSSGADMKLPSKVKIEFDFKTFGQCQFYFIFFADALQSRFKNNYSLNIFSGYIYLQKYSKSKRNSINLGHTQCQDLKIGKGSITLFVDHDKGAITMMVNGKLVKQWVDNKPEKAGKFIYFVNQSQGILKISNLLISKWNGTFVDDADNNVHDVNLDTLLFMNDDFAYGSFNYIKDGFLSFSTDAAEFNVSLNKIKKLSFASKSRRLARKNPNDIKCFISDSTQITFKLNNISNEHIITGISENFGNVSINLDFIRKINMNIYYDNEIF
jgi:hypothetical protein